MQRTQDVDLGSSNSLGLQAGNQSGLFFQQWANEKKKKKQKQASQLLGCVCIFLLLFFRGDAQKIAKNSRGDNENGS